MNTGRDKAVARGRPAGFILRARDPRRTRVFSQELHGWKTAGLDV